MRKILLLTFSFVLLCQNSAIAVNKHETVWDRFQSLGIDCSQVIDATGIAGQCNDYEKLCKIYKKRKFKGLSLVKIGGRINAFGRDVSVSPPESFPFEANVPYTNVWVAEYPLTQYAGINSGEDGNWTAWMKMFERQMYRPSQPGG